MDTVGYNSKNTRYKISSNTTDIEANKRLEKLEKALLICCEEGEVEYDKEILKKANVEIVMVEDAEELYKKSRSNSAQSMGSSASNTTGGTGQEAKEA